MKTEPCSLCALLSVSHLLRRCFEKIQGSSKPALESRWPFSGLSSIAVCSLPSRVLTTVPWKCSESARTVSVWRRGRASCAAWRGSPVCAMVRRRTTSAAHCKCCTFKSWRGMCTASSYVAAQLPAARMVSPLCARPAVLTFQERADMTALGRVLLVITAACCLVGGVQPQVRQAGRVPWRSRHSAEQRERR